MYSPASAKSNTAAQILHVSVESSDPKRTEPYFVCKPVLVLIHCNLRSNSYILKLQLFNLLGLPIPIPVWATSAGSKRVLCLCSLVLTLLQESPWISCASTLVTASTWGTATTASARWATRAATVRCSWMSVSPAPARTEPPAGTTWADTTARYPGAQGDKGTCSNHKHLQVLGSAFK